MCSFARILEKMEMETFDIEAKQDGKKLYDYQLKDLNQIFKRIDEHPDNYNLLYQLPTGGGKTVIFSEISRQYIEKTGKKVLILTHRVELCKQTDRMLHGFGIQNKVIDSRVKELPDQSDFKCFVAMVETLNNRLLDEKFELEDIGLVIIDEAHYNSFNKLFKYFEDRFILGVTATPLSSNVKLPMKNNYDELITGFDIAALIKEGYLAKAVTYSYDVGLTSLKIGINGDYTVKSSELLYTDYPMQEKLLFAYEEKAKGTKTLIFNNGINTSKQVYETFKEAGYNIRHLDNKNSKAEREEILYWFKTTPDAILTSVSILTTGFDEPTVETIVLNRATKSLALYYQMIGRGSRILPDKKEFSVIDLGNNAARFGLWYEKVDWQYIFRVPDLYLETIQTDEEIEKNFVYRMPPEVRAQFPNSKELDFDVKGRYKQILSRHQRPKLVIEESINQHATICCENAEDAYDARKLAELLEDDIKDRVRRYTYCICKSTPSYVQWLEEDYTRKLRVEIGKRY